MTIARNFGLLICASVFAVGCASPDRQTDHPQALASTSRQAEDHLIVPGERYGPVVLGMDREDVVGVIGDPQSRPSLQADQYADGFAVQYDRNNQVLVIFGGGWCEKDDPMAQAFRGVTENGVAIGSTRSEIESALGVPDTVKEVQRSLDFFVMRYDSKGIHLALRNDALVHVTILPPRP